MKFGVRKLRVPLLVGILFIYNSLGSLCLFLLCGGGSLAGGLFYVCIVFAFLVRMPMFMVHLWLPKAHVEAPVAGSMILAGVLLKLGGYGLLRVFPVLFRSGFRFGVVWVALSLVGGLFVSLFCIRQTDLKSLIAYSSVAHISMVIGGIMTLNYSVPPLLYSKGHRRIHNHHYSTNNPYTKGTIHPKRPRQFHTSKSTGNTGTHPTRMILPICIRNSTINPNDTTTIYRATFGVFSRPINPRVVLWPSCVGRYF